MKDNEALTTKLGVVAHVFNPGTREAKQPGTQVPGQPGLPRETLSQGEEKDCIIHKTLCQKTRGQEEEKPKTETDSGAAKLALLAKSDDQSSSPQDPQDRSRELTP